MESQAILHNTHDGHLDLGTTASGGGTPTRVAALQQAGSGLGNTDDASALHPYAACPPCLYTAVHHPGGGKGCPLPGPGAGVFRACFSNPTFFFYNADGAVVKG